MRNRKARAGVTLMELLVVVSLLSLLSTGMLFAIRIGFNALEKTNGQLMANRRVLGAQKALDQQITGMIPVMLPCGGGPYNSRTLFFQGSAGAMRFVSAYSLEEAGRGYPRLLEYAVVRGRDGFGVRMIVNEFLYPGPERLIGFCPSAGGIRPVETNPRSFVLADRLAGCRFSYLVLAGPKKEPAWVPAFATESEPPLAIRVEMAPLQADPSRLQMGTLTIPVRVTRNSMATYKDIDDPEQR